MIDKDTRNKDETEYYNKVIEFNNNRGKSKIQLRNHRAEMKRKQQCKDLLTRSESQIKETQNKSSINSISMKPGEFRMVQCNIKNKTYHALIDSGASHSCINEKIATKLNIHYTRQSMQMSTATGCDSQNVLGNTSIDINISDNINKMRKFTIKLLILQNTNGFDLIFGADVLFNNCESTITNDMWEINHIKHQQKIRIPLKKRNEINKIINIRKSTIQPGTHQLIQARLTLNNYDTTRDTIVHENIKQNGLKIDFSIDKHRIDEGNTITFVRISNNSHKPIEIHENEQLSTAEFRSKGPEKVIEKATFMNMISKSPSQNQIDKEFDKFIHTPNPTKNIKFDNRDNDKQLNFTESLKQLHNRYPDKLLPDNYSENILTNHTQSILGDKYINN